MWFPSFQPPHGSEWSAHSNVKASHSDFASIRVWAEPRPWLAKPWALKIETNPNVDCKRTSEEKPGPVRLWWCSTPTSCFQKFLMRGFLQDPELVFHKHTPTCFILIHFKFWKNFRFVEEGQRWYREPPYTPSPHVVTLGEQLLWPRYICHNKTPALGRH